MVPGSVIFLVPVGVLVIRWLDSPRTHSARAYKVNDKAVARNTAPHSSRFCGKEPMISNPEQSRLGETRRARPIGSAGVHLSERAWGTVREDYSADGDAWNYFLHDHARAAGRIAGAEDGMGGFCDDKQYLCLAVALWKCKGPDPQRAHVRPD